MFIVHIASEFAGVAKVGGLADVVQGLTRELSIRGNHVEVILPRYEQMRMDRVWGYTKSYADLWVPFHNFWVHCDVYFGFVDGVKTYFIESHFFKNFFNRSVIYGDRDDPERFAFFSKAAMEFLLKSGKHPDVIHVHDWQTAMVPLLLAETYKHFGMTHPRVCFTIHNVHHQGITGDHVLRQNHLNPSWYLGDDRLGDDHRAARRRLRRARTRSQRTRGPRLRSTVVNDDAPPAPKSVTSIRGTGQGFNCR